MIIGILKDSGNFKLEKLKTPADRRELENNFKKICQSVISDKDSFFLKNQNPSYKIETKVMELQSPGPLEIGHLLRLQSRISIKQFGMDLRDQFMMGKNFFKILFEQREIVQMIINLKYLLKWAKIIYNKYNAQLTIDEAKDLTINEIIERENANPQIEY